MNAIRISRTVPLRQRDILLFWIPLVLTWLFMAFEGPYLTALIARLHEPKFNLAAFGVALALLLICEGPILMLISASIALIKNRDSFLTLRRYAISLSLLMTAFMALVACDPFFRLITSDLMELEPEVRSLVRISLWILLPCPFAVGYRRFYQGFLVRSNRTRLVAAGTFIRLVSMTATALLFYLSPSPVPGAYVGAAGLTAGMVCEALAVRLMARMEIARLMVSESSGEEPLTIGAFTSFYAPLAITTILSLSVQPMVTLFVSHGRLSLESLAVLPVVNSLVLLFRSFGLSYQEAVVALSGGSRQRLIAVSIFAAMAGLISSGLLACMAFTPLGPWWLIHSAGLTPELAEIAELPLRIMCVMPGLTVLLAWQRGLLVCRKATRPITTAAIIEVLVISGLLYLGIEILDLVGAVAACLAVSIGEMVGFGLLMLYLAKLLPQWAEEPAAETGTETVRSA